MTDLRFAYGTNGLGDHRLEDALTLVADAGYQGVALTLDHHHLDPLAADLAAQTKRVARLLEHVGLAAVIETGGRFVLDPLRKHEPTLLADRGRDRDRRLALLHTAVDVAAELQAPVVHLWSGRRPPDVAVNEAWHRLIDGCERLLPAVERAGVSLAFEPEPGMLVERLDDVERLMAELDHHPQFGVTLDIGHCVCLEHDPVPVCIERVAPHLFHVQIEDMRRGVHEHLPFGTGDLDLPASLAALHGVAYTGLVSVELARDAHRAHRLVPESLRALRQAEQEVVCA